jgi:hypothetical protein
VKRGDKKRRKESIVAFKKILKGEVSVKKRGWKEENGQV